MKCVNMTENYSFSANWTDQHSDLWKHFIPKDISSVLEIGNWEGRSTIWFADYFDQAQITSIDPSKWGNRHTLLSNISKSPNVSRIKLIFEKSEDALPHLPKNSFDFIYIDGNHHAPNLLLDGLYSFLLLKKEGIIVFDDYNWGGEDRFGNKTFKSILPKEPIEYFISIMDCEVLHLGYQAVIKKCN